MVSASMSHTPTMAPSAAGAPIKPRRSTPTSLTPPETSGRSIGLKAWRTPASVITPIRPFKCEEKRALSTSAEPGDVSSAPLLAMRLALRSAEITTSHGISETCKSTAGAFTRVGGGSNPAMIVLRGVSKAVAASFSSWMTVERILPSSSSKDVRCSISARSASCSVCNSSAENLVSRRSLSSKMYSTWSSESEKASCRFAFAS